MGKNKFPWIVVSKYHIIQFEGKDKAGFRVEFANSGIPPDLTKEEIKQWDDSLRIQAALVAKSLQRFVGEKELVIDKTWVTNDPEMNIESDEIKQ